MKVLSLVIGVESAWVVRRKSHALAYEASLKDSLVPSSNIIGKFVSKDARVFGKFVFMCETVDNIVGLCTHHMYPLLLAHIFVVSLDH